MTGRHFQRRVETFTCLHCGRRVEGSGYTNHCPSCLWSRHVDVRPGDRSEACRGAMQPIDVEEKGGRYVLVHACGSCGTVRRNRVDPADDFDAVLEIARRASVDR